MLGWLGLSCQSREVDFITFCLFRTVLPPSTSAPPLTVENVCEAVLGVKWTVLGRQLIPKDKYDEMKQLQDTSNENHLRAVVECWLGGGHATGQEPTWRSLIWTLDAGGQTRVADKIRHFAEPVLGKSCDSISVSTFLYSVL